MSWNIHGLEGPDLDAVAEVVGAAGADVVAVQEIQRRQAQHLARRLGMDHRWDRKHDAGGPLLPPPAEGLAVLSPHGIDRPGAAEISDGRSRWSYRRRIAQWATVRPAGRRPIWVCNVHLSPHELAEERRAEARRTSELADEHAGDLPVVVVGDLNDGEDPTMIELLPAIEHVRPGPTNPASSPSHVLDHVLLPPTADDVTIGVPAGGTAWAALSDHLPVTCSFALPDGPAS